MTAYEQPAHDEGDAVSAAPGGVLVVDDEALLLQAMSLILTDAGYEVYSASDGFEAVAQYGEHSSRIRAVVLDLSMPHTRGEVVLRMLRDIAPHLPVLISTGSSARHLLDNRPAGEGAIGYLMKPYAADVLLEKLQSLIAGGGGHDAGA